MMESKERTIFLKETNLGWYLFCLIHRKAGGTEGKKRKKKKKKLEKSGN